MEKMINEEILKKAVEKAVNNGFNKTSSGGPVTGIDVNRGGIWFWEENGIGAFYPATEIIFSEDFAKAFWGEEDSTAQMAQIVLEEDPVRYLEQFL